jgi:serine/threonine protein kinase
MANKGSSACVIPQTNQHMCSDNLNPEKRYITKIMENDKASKELENYEKLDKLTGNKNNEYYIGDPIQCDLPSPIDKELLNNQDCNYKFNVQDGTLLTLIDYEDGGSSLSTILKEHDAVRFYNKLFNGLLNIFKAIKLLNDHDIYHFDIKPENIVGDLKSEPFKLRLVDLGDSKHIPPNKYQPNYNSIGTIGYMAPEKYGSFSTANFYIGTKNILTHHVLNNETFSLQLISTGEKFTQDQYKTLKEKHPTTWYAKSDVWSLGVTLIDILENIKNEEVEKKLNIDDLRETVIQPMIMLNVEKRVNSSKALKLYTDWLNRHTHDKFTFVRPSPLGLQIPATFTTPSPTPSPTPLRKTNFEKSISFPVAGESTNVGGKSSKRQSKFTKRKKERKINKKHYKTRRRIKTHRNKSRKI